MAINRMGDRCTALLRNDSEPSVNHRIEVIKQFASTYPGVQNVREVPAKDGATYFRIEMRGTFRAMRHMQMIWDISGLECDPNSDHDHARCIATAKAMGVPESWAHQPETYLSM